MIDSKGAIFDLDGTLLNSLHVWEQIDIRFLGKRGILVTEDYTKAVTPLGFERAAQYTIERYGLSESPEEIISEWNRMADEAYATEVRLKPNAREFLLYLKDRGIKLGVATALHPASVEATLRHNGIYDLFDSFTMLHEVTRGKNFPDIYLLAAGKLGIAPADCIVFEDILAAVKGARAGGFRVCGVYDSYAEHEWQEIREQADLHIRDYRELMEEE